MDTTGEQTLDVALPSEPPVVVEPSPGYWAAALRGLAGRAVGRPLLVIGIGFALACAIDAGDRLPAAWSVIPVCFGVAGLWRGRSVWAILSALFLLAFGVGLVRVATCVAGANPMTAGETVRFCDAVGVIVSQPESSAHATTFTIQLSAADTGQGALTPIDARALVALIGAASENSVPLAPGDRIRLSGLAGPVRGRSEPALSGEGVVSEITVKRAGAVTVVGQDPRFWFARIAGALHARSVSVLEMCLAPDDAAAAAAIFLGDKTALAPAVTSAFARTGTAHLLATAGLHVGILTVALVWLSERLTVPRRWMAASGMAIVWLYALMAGGRPAVVRAAFVASVYLAAILLERIPDLLSALGLCALVLLWQRPGEAQDAGFQLTFLTVLGIAALMPGLMQVWRPAVEKIRSAKAAHSIRRALEVESLSLAAQAAAAPLVAVYFNTVTLYGLPANLIVVPVMFVLMPALLLMLILAAVWPPAAIALAHAVVAPCLHLSLGLVAGIANLPHASLSVASPGWPAVALYYAVLFGLSFAVQTVASARAARPDGADRSAAAEPVGALRGMEPGATGL